MTHDFMLMIPDKFLEINKDPKLIRKIRNVLDKAIAPQYKLQYKGYFKGLFTGDVEMGYVIYFKIKPMKKRKSKSVTKG